MPESPPIVQRSDLLPGDILLFRPRKPNRLQEMVSKAIHSPYTHAAIYVGDGAVAEAVMPSGIAESHLNDDLDDSLCVAVLRTQLGFGAGRREKLLEFVATAIADGAPFHRRALANFGEGSKSFFDSQLEIINARFGQSETAEELAVKGYFCSGL
jgi:hypothetical protein